MIILLGGTVEHIWSNPMTVKQIHVGSLCCKALSRKMLLIIFVSSNIRTTIQQQLFNVSSIVRYFDVLATTARFFEPVSVNELSIIIVTNVDTIYHSRNGIFLVSFDTVSVIYRKIRDGNDSNQRGGFRCAKHEREQWLLASIRRTWTRSAPSGRRRERSREAGRSFRFAAT